MIDSDIQRIWWRITKYMFLYKKHQNNMVWVDEVVVCSILVNFYLSQIEIKF